MQLTIPYQKKMARGSRVRACNGGMNNKNSNNNRLNGREKETRGQKDGRKAKKTKKKKGRDDY